MICNILKYKKMFDGNPANYRLRLFLSVDAKDSTRFKNEYQGQDNHIQGSGNKENILAWADEIIRFYSDFPTILQKEFAKHSNEENRGPNIWKTIGDEIVFTCKVTSLEHLKDCMSAFNGSVKIYNNSVKILFIKASAWVAPFPTTNVTIKKSNRPNDSDMNPCTIQSFLERGNKSWIDDEETEDIADRNPENCEFIGREIDAGFRLSAFASTEKLILSPLLGWLLLKYNALNEGIKFEVYWNGTRDVKGVTNNNDYPIIYLYSGNKEDSDEKNILEVSLPDQNVLFGLLSEHLENKSIGLPDLRERDSGVQYLKGRLPYYDNYLKIWCDNILERFYITWLLLDYEKKNDFTELDQKERNILCNYFYKNKISLNSLKEDGKKCSWLMDRDRQNKVWKWAVDFLKNLYEPTISEYLSNISDNRPIKSFTEFLQEECPLLR